MTDDVYACSTSPLALNEVGPISQQHIAAGRCLTNAKTKEGRDAF